MNTDLLPNPFILVPGNSRSCSGLILRNLKCTILTVSDKHVNSLPKKKRED